MALGFSELGPERKRGAGKREEQAREGREEGVRSLIPSSRGSATAILADDGRAVASGGLASDTELFPCPEEDDDPENGLGRFRTSARKEERERELGWKRPKAREVYFFSFKSIFYFCFSKILCYFIKRVCRFKIIYENLKLLSLLHNK
jgi:hypothetical protein